MIAPSDYGLQGQCGRMLHQALLLTTISSSPALQRSKCSEACSAEAQIECGCCCGRSSKIRAVELCFDVKTNVTLLLGRDAFHCLQLCFHSLETLFSVKAVCEKAIAVYLVPCAADLAIKWAPDRTRPSK